MKKYNPVKSRLRECLLNLFPYKEVSSNSTSFFAPCLLLKLSFDEQMIEMTVFDAESGKHYSAWYLTPSNYDDFNKKLMLSKSKLASLKTT